METLPMAAEGLIGACCTLGTDELRERLTAWRALRRRAIRVERTEAGVRLLLRADEQMDSLARLVVLEAECCPFYRFTLEIVGPGRQLSIEAGPGGGEAVAALLGIPAG